MDMPRQVKPQPRLFMQEIVGREWVPEAEARSVPKDLLVAKTAKPKRRGRKSASSACLHRLTTFSVAG
ncbi:hypothetical protein [Jiella sonneratiae]|uniref:Uncharacterized protein n=1 Tax=Jiella sonneratiae TaxID=2816856 RepID=A0ABS3IXG4_9HYPH|nr:hypothetical protein [Jiella sonneratiae]MBO0902097.1 hypothetical protein [Jiella sonneratiae]